MRRAAGIAAAALAVIALTPSAVADERASLPDIEDEVMCTICGTTLEGAGTAPQAERQRELIRSLIAEGETKEQIKAALVAEYGPDVLAVPDDSGFDLVAWIVPIVGFAVAVGVLGFVLVRMRGSGAGAGTGVTVSPADRERIDRDLARRGS